MEVPVLNGISDEGCRQNRTRAETVGVRKQEVARPNCQEKWLNDEDRALVPQTDTGRWVEDTKANGRTFVKELGNIAP
jgi:hypothetical protein